MAAPAPMENILRRRATGTSTAVAALACGLFGLAGVTDAQAQVGIGVAPSASPTGTVGNNKNQAGSAGFLCPAGTVAIGLRHRDKTTVNNRGVYGITTQFGLFCASLVPTATGVIVEPLSTTQPSAVTSYNYNNQSDPMDRLCGTGQIIHRVGGWDRDWDQGSYPAWSSALTMVCDTVTKDASDWVRITVSNNAPTLVGIIETRPTSAFPNHVERGPFCDNTATTLVTGLFAQRGGEGIDGVNVYCGGLSQARFSAAMTFTDFAWSQTRGAGNWLVDLRRGSELLQNSAGMTGAGRTPYATVAANAVIAFAVANEVYVVPNSDYRAVVSNRPTGISAAAYATSGSCTTGLTLTNEVDGSCLLTIDGLADLATTVVAPPNTFRAYDQAQPVTVTISNRGPGATVAADGFRVTASLPAGWSASGLPAGCALTGQVVSCPLPALAASASPGTDGGQTSFTFNVLPVSPTANGSFTMAVSADASVPNGDANPGNNDYDLTNNNANATLVLLRNAQLNLSKVWSNAVVNDTAVLTATAANQPPISLTSTANQASETDTGTAGEAPLEVVYTLGEVLGSGNAGAYNPSAWSCTGGALSGNQLTIRPEDSGQTITCAITNARRSADVQVTKTSASPSVRSGQDIVWTITAVNNGPDGANNTVLRDQPGEGMDCEIVPPACTASNGASCPSNISIQTLADGVEIPQLPNEGQVAISLTCRATATGAP